MLDFMSVRMRKGRTKGTIEIYPFFMVQKSQDLMIQGGDFYAIWDEDAKLWSKDEYRAVQLIDKEIRKVYDEELEKYGDGEGLVPLYLRDFDSTMIDKWHKYVQKSLRDNYVPLDENIIFSNQDTTRESYASIKLSYELGGDSYAAWDELVSVLYSPKERHKIEWIIGAIAKGESKKLQKFVVFYGSGGTGKSTILNIIDKMFEGYSTSFDAKALGSANSAFSLEPFKTNPLVAIDHDSNLSKIEDNTRINSLVSHERMVVNEKHKKLYNQNFYSMLLIGTNNPVKITDAKSGIIRRLIDVSPTGNLVPSTRYKELLNDINYQLGAIVKHCIEVFEADPHKYDDYIPINMIGSTNHFYDFILEEFNTFNSNEYVTKAVAYDLYKNYCTRSNIAYPMNALVFKEELKNYFKEFHDRKQVDGKLYYSCYEGFLADKFMRDKEESDEEFVEEYPNWLILSDMESSAFDDECKECPAQYATKDETPKQKWSEVRTVLSQINPRRLHYVKVPDNHIVIDFDLKDENGKKSLAKNLEAAKEFPATYAEVSKGGGGLHLHYIYAGDVDKLANTYTKDIEVKIFTKGSSLRRKLSLCNTLPFTVISSGLPLRKEKKDVISEKSIKNERQLRAMIGRNLLKDYLPGTKPSIDFIEKLLNEAYESDIQYDVTDMRPDVMQFAASSTNHADYCIKRVKHMKFKSDGDIDDNVVPFNEESPIVIFDVEVFPNLFVLCWKKLGEKNKVVKMINPRPEDVRKLYMNCRLVGFNNRRYDNHVVYAAGEGYSNEELYMVSQKIVNNSANAFFGQAYNLSYTDIYDFASSINKKSLKKFEIELGIHHQELGLDWSQPVPEELWDTVADYCTNDVLATEAVWYHLQGDWNVRKILVNIADKMCPDRISTVNDSTNTLSTRIIFGANKHPQSEFCYRDLSKPVVELDDAVADYISTYTPIDATKKGFKPHYIPNAEESILPYFPGYGFDDFSMTSTYRGLEPSEGGYVYSQPGVWHNVGLLDISSMHPSSAEDECLFGPEYTRNFSDIKQARLKFKHSDFDGIENYLDGALVDTVKEIEVGNVDSSDVSTAFKTVINSAYGLTKAKFDNPFRDPRNIDNIVAKRGALFMIDLKYAVEDMGYTVVHIKTDSIKIADVDDKIIKFVMDFGLRYGYTFEHEATYEKLCLVNKAVYIAKDANDGHWTATGEQFKVPYVFKKLFSKEEIEPRDLMQVFNVKTALYLDYNESMKPDEHSYHFIGRTGAFYPIISGRGGGELKAKRGEKYDYAGGSKGYRWLEAEVVDQTDRIGDIDLEYWDKQVDEAKKAIEQFCSYEEFVGDFPMNPPSN